MLGYVSCDRGYAAGESLRLTFRLRRPRIESCGEFGEVKI